MLSHYDGLLVAVPALVILVAFVRKGESARPYAKLGAIVPGLLVGLIVVSLFYLPFLLHRNFEATYAYLVGQRLITHQSFPYQQSGRHCRT
jgi:hypothetical protein